MATRRQNNIIAFQNIRYIDVTPQSEPDPDWRYTDGHGHLHSWKGDNLPTLTYQIDMSATDEYPETGHFVCSQCGDHVVPGWRVPLPRQFIRGE